MSRYLEKNDIETWYAPRDIPAGSDWPNAIENAIKSCSAFILLFCSKADSSQQVKRELALADKYHKQVFWVKIENVEPNNLGYFLTATQWINWLDNRDDTLQQLVSDIYAIEKTSTSSETADPAAGGHTRTKRESFWAKAVLAFPSDKDAAECAARVYFDMATTHPDSSMILPTGRSATMIFRAMNKIADEYEGCPFGEAHIISDTETFGVWSEHETSRTKHIKDMLIAPLKRKHKEPPEENIHLLSGVYTDDDPVKSAQRTIRLFPPAVHAVSLSPLGEVLAYEVGTYNDIDEIIDDAPRVVEVGEHSKKYIDPNQPSKSILTIGLGTALQSEILLIVAFDIQKASIVNRLFNGPMTAGIPATLLRNHPNAYILTTEKVAAEAKVLDLSCNIKNASEAARWIIEN